MIRSFENFGEKEYKSLGMALQKYFIQRKRNLSRSRKSTEETSIITKLQARKFAKDTIKEVKSGKRVCVAHIWSQYFDPIFMIGQVSRRGVALLTYWYVGDGSPASSRIETLGLYRAFAEKVRDMGAERVIAISDYRDNLFINALETMDFEEINWGKDVIYGKRLSFTDDKKH